MKFIVRACSVVIVLLLCAASAHAQQWTPFPGLGASPGPHVGINPVLLIQHDWDEAEECLASLESSVGATYYAAVVPITDGSGLASPSANDAVPYVDALYDNWAAKHSIDPERHIVMAFGLENRAVAIHPGTEFVGWGFERDAITRAIDSSGFKSYARAGDYPKAVCTLAKGVDSTLGQMRATAMKRGADAKASLDELRAAFAEVPDLVERAEELDPRLGNYVRGQTVTAQERFEAAKNVIDDRPFQAWEYTEQASRAMENAQNAVQNYESFEAKIPKWKEEIAERRKRIESRPDTDWALPQRALEQLDECEQLIETSRERLATQGLTPTSLEYCVTGVDITLADADTRHTFVTVVVPSVVGGAVALVLLILFVIAIVRRNRMLRLVEAEMKSWEQALGTASERLLDLEREFSLYFDTGRPAWTGTSARLDQDCADEVNRVFLMFSKAKDIHDEAIEMLDDASPIRTSPLEAILEHLKSAEVVIETGEVETRRRIFLPLTREYRADASKLLSDLSGSYERAAKLLEEATFLMERVDALRVRLASNSSDLSDAISTRSTAGFPVEHLVDAQGEGESKRAAGNRVADTDPKTAITHLERAAETLEEALHIATVGNAVIHHVREEASGYRARLRARIDTMRENGWTVKEPGFDPDQRLDRAVRVGQRAIELVAGAEEEEANVVWSRLEADLEQLDQQLEATKDARDGVPKTLQEYRARFDENEARVPKAKEVLAELDAEHSTQAYQRESDNLDEYAALREQVQAGFESVRKAHSGQRYLVALTDLETLDHALETSTALLDELEAILAELEKARKEARAQLGRAQKNLDGIDEARKDRLGIDAELDAEITEAREETGDIEALIGEERPHWLETRRRATEVATHSQELLDEVHRELNQHAEAVRLHHNLAERITELARQVRAETRDRPHVAALVSDTSDALERTRTKLDEPTIGGEELFVAVDEVRKWYDRAHQAWQTELDLIHQAEAELAAATRRYQQVDGTSYGYGVYASCSDAEDTLEEARQAIAARDWAAAATFAARAKRQVDSESNRAQNAADRKRRAAQRRSRSTSSTSFSSSSFSSSSSSFSSSSWSSSSSSFSGGSSFGSSSGGSSW
jgi:hypothetical protein